MGVEVVFLCRFDGFFFTGVNPETNPAQFGFVYVRLKQDVNGLLLLAFYSLGALLATYFKRFCHCGEEFIVCVTVVVLDINLTSERS